MEYKLQQGDNIELLKKLPDNSIDSIVTDPPYGLSFMNKKWDYDVPSVELWKEVYRVLKPGGHVLSFGGTRTYHRMVVNMEDAGFEIRDQIMWLYGSGFPKSHNIGKAVDKFGGNNLLSTEIGSKLKEARTSRGLTLKQADELFCNGTSNYNWLEGRSDGQRIPNQELFDKIVREWPELKDLRDKVVASERELLGIEITNKTVMKNIGETNVAGEYERTKGQSPWEGWGTALKPANEPICVARKPLSEKSVAENVLKWGTGGINIDGCRVDLNGDNTGRKLSGANDGIFNCSKVVGSVDDKWMEGRFPANIILECICDEVIKGEKGEVKSNTIEAAHTNPMCPCRLMDDQSGVSKSTGAIRKKDTETDPSSFDLNKKIGNNSNVYAGQEGGASRFFYQAKVSKKERNMGLDEFEEKGDIHTNPMCPCRLMDEQSGVSVTKANMNYNHNKTESDSDVFKSRGTYTPRSDSGGASRFFYQAKVSKKERNMGLDGFEEKESQQKGHGLDRICMNEGCGVSMLKPELCKCDEPDWRPRPKKNSHPTVKPVNLMAYLCRLITPPGGTILDMYMGSGSTGIAALLEGFNFIGMDLDPEYVKIAEARISNYEKYREFLKK